MGKLSHRLLDLGLFCALGTSEHPGHSEEEQHVKHGTPNTFDCNNGVVVIYDEEGRPWIKSVRDVTDEVRRALWTLNYTFNVQHGAYVPHSNDGGHFVRTVLPTL
ncbi:MAG: hypothetical protein HYT31_03530 [Parcubacteria group bacterium]|nr:hypothetical protein [Parcubacteria group bacterium]